MPSETANFLSRALLLPLLLTLIVASGSPADASLLCPPALPGVGMSDFNGDGFCDLAVGAPYEDIGAAFDAGAVNVIYGSSAGLTGNGDQLWHQNSLGIEDAAESRDYFGQSVAGGDFNRDGFADLAIGAYGEGLGDRFDAGVVNVIYGSSIGLTSNGDQLWHQDRLGVEDTHESGDRFGSSLAVADFNGDGFADLAAGVPNESLFGINGGAVHILYGSSAGLAAAGDQLLSQNTPGVDDAADDDDWFGGNVVTGNFNGDAYGDLAVSNHLENVGTVDDAGAVNVIYGGPGGLSGVGSDFWHQDSGAIEGASEQDDELGWSITSGDFDANGVSDLAIGVPFEDVGTITDAGVVNVIYGTAGVGLTDSADEIWHQNTANVEGIAERFDDFGDSLTAGDFDGDQYFDDLAIAASNEDVGSIRNAGAVNVLYGIAGEGLTSARDEIIDQNTPDIEGRAETDDSFGLTLAAADFDADAISDLVVGVPLEDLDSIVDAGLVNVVYGAPGGLSAVGNRTFSQNSTGIEDAAEVGDFFGYGLGAGGTIR